MPTPTEAGAFAGWLFFLIIGGSISAIGFLLINWPSVTIWTFVGAYPLWVSALLLRARSRRGQYLLASVWLLAVGIPITWNALRNVPDFISGSAVRPPPNASGEDAFSLAIEWILFAAIALVALTMAASQPWRRPQYEDFPKPFTAFSVMLILIGAVAGPLFVLVLHFGLMAIANDGH